MATGSGLRLITLSYSVTAFILMFFFSFILKGWEKVWRGVVAGALTGFFFQPLSWYFSLLFHFSYKMSGTWGMLDPIAAARAALFIGFPVMSVMVGFWIIIGALFGAFFVFLHERAVL